MTQSTTNLGKIHVFPSETLYNQFKDSIADNDLALLKDDGAYIVAANLARNGYVKFSNGLLVQWGTKTGKEASTNNTYTFPIAFTSMCYQVVGCLHGGWDANCTKYSMTPVNLSTTGFEIPKPGDGYRYIAIGR